MLQRLPLGLPLGPHRVGLGAQVGQLLAQLLQPGLAGRVVLLGQRRLLDLQPGHPPGQLVELGRHRVDLGAQHRAGLVDEVDRLVGQEPVGDVAVAERHRGDQRAVLDLHAVEHLEPLAQPAQDRDGVLDRRLVDEHRLEAALQRGVLLDVLAVLVEGGRADHVQLAAGEHRLEHVAGVHRTLGGAGADDGVQLVDEQQDPALGGRDLVQHGLEPLLELAAVLRAGDERAHVEGEDRLVPQALGHVAVDDPLGQTLDDRGLADAGSPISTGLFFVLRDRIWTTRRISASRPMTGSSLPVRARRRRGRGRTSPAPRRSTSGIAEVTRWLPRICGQRLQEAVAGEPLRREQPAGRRRRALVEQREHEVLDRDVLVLEPLGLAARRRRAAGPAAG